MAARMAPRNSDSPLAYLNGQLIAAEGAQLPVWDRGVVQGATVTEMIRTFQRVPFRQEAHFARLRGSLDYLGVTLSETDEELAAVIERLIESIVDDAEFCQMWRSGVSGPKIAAHFGVHINTVGRHVRRLGLVKRR